MKRMLSGIKPTGEMHIGNYFGALKQWVEMQYEYDSFIFIPDYHALITVQDKNKMEELVYNTALNLLAIGIDPNQVTLYKQSDIPAHTELCWIFNCLTTMPQLMRGHAFKDGEAKKKEVSVGLFDYPVLQAADIALYDTEVVPVGEDQRQHIEMTREIVRKFNNTFGDTFIEPDEYIKEEVGTIVGSDGQKMSKSYGNQLSLFASEEETLEYIMAIPMDSKKVEEFKNPDEYTLYKIASLFCNKEQDVALRAMFSEGGVGYGEIKEHIARIINDYLREMRTRRVELAQNPEYIKQMLQEGALKAQEIADHKMKEVREKIGFTL
ncbi:MAG: tryptophan--tRNA ligase [Patescibacteria group bacterium]